jgi:hypothetical protein
MDIVRVYIDSSLSSSHDSQVFVFPNSVRFDVELFEFYIGTQQERGWL